MEIGNFFFEIVSIETMPNYAARLSYSYDMARALVGAWALKCDNMAVYEHIGTQTEKVHIHLVMTGTSVDKKQLRNIGSKFLNCKGQENLSFSEKEYDGSPRFMSYMTKGVHDPKYLKGWTNNDHIAWKDAWVPPNKKQVKEHRDVKIYREFCVCEGYEIEQEISAVKLLVVIACAKHYVRETLGMPFSVNACNIYKMLVRTYCYDNKISIPDASKLAW